MYFGQGDRGYFVSKSDINGLKENVYFLQFLIEKIPSARWLQSYKSYKSDEKAAHMEFAYG